MPSGLNKRSQLDDILSDKVSVMDTEDLNEDSASLIEEEAQPGFCVECKDQAVSVVLPTSLEIKIALSDQQI